MLPLLLLNAPAPKYRGRYVLLAGMLFPVSGTAKQARAFAFIRAHGIKQRIPIYEWTGRSWKATSYELTLAKVWWTS